MDIDLVKKLRDVATTKIQHLYQGCCPDSLDGFDERDTECEACRIILEIENIIKNSTLKGCHVDYKIRTVQKHNWCIYKECVHDYGKPNHCDTAMTVKSKEECEHWREIEDFEYYEGKDDKEE